MARDSQSDRAAIVRAAKQCLAQEHSRNISALSAACGIPRSTLYRRYADVVDDFRQQCARADSDQPGVLARLRSDLLAVRQRDRDRLARITALEAENHSLRNAARLLQAENAELRAAHDEGRSARIVRLDQPASRPDIGAFSWEQLRDEYLALIKEHAETKADLARARRTVTRFTRKQASSS